MYHSQRHPCRAAMLFIRRNVPLRIPDVSAKASFCPQHYQPTCSSRPQAIARTIWLSCTVDSRTSFPIPIVICPQPHQPPHPFHPNQPKLKLTHILEQLHLGRQALQRLVVLPLEVVREPLSLHVRVPAVPAAAAAATTAERGRPPGRGRRVVLVRAQQRSAVVQAACARASGRRGSVPAGCVTVQSVVRSGARRPGKRTFATWLLKLESRNVSCCGWVQRLKLISRPAACEDHEVK